MELKSGKQAARKMSRGVNTGPWAVVGFVVGMLTIGVVASLGLIKMDNGPDWSQLLAIGATIVVIGTVTQMTVSWVDPVGIREMLVTKELSEALSALKRDEADKAIETAIGKEAVETLKAANGHGTWLQRVQTKRMLKRFRKAWKDTSDPQVDKALEVEIADLRRRENQLNWAAIAWSCLALGSIMLAVGAWFDFSVEPSAVPLECVVTMESSVTPPTNYSCEVTIKDASNQPSQ